MDREADRPLQRAPRLFGISATRAPVVAVLRRGPSAWSALGRWDTASMTYEAGTWVRATVYPQRCDLSPDGRWFAAFVLNQHADWPAGSAYVSVSRLPWLTALTAWGIGSTWTNGVHFLDDRTAWSLPEPDVGDAEPCRNRYGLAWTHAASFAVERRRGWVETEDTPPRAEHDVWDQSREVTMRRSCPGATDHELRVTGWHAAFRAFEPDRFGPTAYWLLSNGRRTDLSDVQWADWSSAGEHLLVATLEGRLQARSRDGRDVSWEHDLATDAPHRTPPPPAARDW
jgi:hypothetical protein